MSKWIETTVGQATKFQRAGGTPTATNSEYYGGKIPFVIIEDITNSSRYLEQTEKSLTKKGLRNSAAWLLTKPYILYSMYATVGKPVINKINCATNQAIIALEEEEHLDQLFLYYQLLLIRPQVYKYTAQTTQSNLNAGTVKKLIISYPQDKRVQQEISRILTSIDDTIEKTEALIHKYQQIKVGLMHDLFTRGVTADGKLRPPREQAPELYKETPIGWIPKEWDFVTIGECTVSWAMGPRFSAEEYNEYGNVATLRTTDIDQNGFIEYSTMPIARLQLYGLLNHILKQKDFVITRSGTCGICAIFDDFPLPVLPGAFLIRFRFNDSLSEEYMKNYLNSENGKPLVYRVAEGGVQKNLRGTSLCKIKFPRPKLDEQKRIDLRIQAVDKLLTDESCKNEKLIKQKSGLMHDLLTGKVPVKIDQKETTHV